MMAGGRVQCLAIASPQRSALVPDLPTVSESGLPGFEATTWFGVMVPSGTARPTVTMLHQAFAGALKVAHVRDRILKQGFEIVGSDPEAFGAYVRAEIPKWAKVVKASGAGVD
ncbi:MAG: tripartite tricarboxylate transporter substrate-binding protein [Burkholderiales bacterium]